MGNSYTPRCHLQLPPHKWLLGSSQETCTSWCQLQGFLPRQLGFEYTRGCDDSVSANGKGMGLARIAQIQGCYFWHVLDGRFVRVALTFQARWNSEADNFSVIVASCIRLNFLLGYREADITCETVRLQSAMKARLADRSQGIMSVPGSGLVSKSTPQS